MTPEQFCYWLQGFNEINRRYPTEKEWEIIADHLKTVFFKTTPSYLDSGKIPPEFFPQKFTQGIRSGDIKAVC